MPLTEKSFLGAPLCGLYAITPASGERERLYAQVEAALAGGARFLQYRDKQSPADERLRRACELRTLCDRHGASFIVNDSVELAVAAGADGVHLGAEDGDPAAARAVLGPAAVIGVSCYADLDRARLAVAAGADYVAFGAAFASASKPGAPAVPLARIAEACATLPVPVAAIGGITVDNARPLIAAGVSLLAVIFDLFSAPDIGARATQFSRLFPGTDHEHA